MNALAPSTRTVAGDFIAAANKHSLEDVVALLTSDCVIDVPTVPPAGIKYVSAAEAGGFWADALSADGDSLIVDERIAATDDRAVLRWRSARRHGLYIVQVREGRISNVIVYGWE